MHEFRNSSNSVRPIKIGYNYSKRPINYGIIEDFNYKYPTNRFWFGIVGPFAKYLLQPLLYKTKVEGLENVPKDSNFIIMPNHISHADSFFAYGNIWPRKAVNFIADEKLFVNKYFRRFAAMFNAFPVRKGTKSTKIVNYAINRIKNGDSMLWYPEGQRHKNPSENHTYPGKLGSGMLAHAVDVPIIPCFLYGPEFVMPVGKGIQIGNRLRSIKILVRYGKPVPLDDLRSLPPSKETSQLVVNRIMQSIENLRPKGEYVNQLEEIKKLRRKK